MMMVDTEKTDDFYTKAKAIKTQDLKPLCHPVPFDSSLPMPSALPLPLPSALPSVPLSLPPIPKPSSSYIPQGFAGTAIDEKKWSLDAKTFDVRGELFTDFKDESHVLHTSELDSDHWECTQTPATQLIWTPWFANRKDRWPMEQGKDKIFIS